MIRDYGPTGVPGLRFWGGAASFSYYRPAVFSIWEVDQMLLNGHFDPVGLHLLNLLAYGLTGSALAILVRRITRLPLAGVIAGLVFVLFPFNVNDAIWVASLFHILPGLCAALAIWFGLMWLDGRRRLLSLVLCCICAFVGVFSHENGVLVLPLLGLLIPLVYGWRSLRQPKVWLLLALIAAVVGLYIFLSVKVPRPLAPVTLLWSMFPDSMAVFLQGMVYPFAAIIRQLTHPGATTLILLALAAVVILPALALVARRSWTLALAAGYGVVWYVAGALPSALLLETEYIKGSPRLMLFSSLGAGVFWGVTLAVAWSNLRTGSELYRRVKRAAAALAAGVAVAGLVISVYFLGLRRAEALIQSAYMWRLLALVEQATGNAPLLVNSPSWLATRDENRLFLTASEAVMFMHTYVNHAQQFWAETGRDFPPVTMIVYAPTYNPPADIEYATLENPSSQDFTMRLRAASDIYVTVFEGRDIYPVYVGSPGMAGPDTPLVNFPDAGLSLTQAEAELAGDTVTVRTRWRVEKPGAFQPFVRVSCDGEQVGQSAGAIWGGMYPFRVWQPGEIQTDLREIRLSRSVTKSCLQIYGGLSGEGNDTPLRALVTSTGQRVERDLVPMTVR
jgi:hypothetical protein